ncbi:MAG: DNA/RNA non-specific endonuclease [Bacteroidota bacterium]
MRLLIFFILLSNVAWSQLIIDKGIYKANFSNKLHQPRYVSYTLYKGGGDCERAHFSFKNDINGAVTATDHDYAGSGYDKGHLANAEDFAFDCQSDELTFRYYNCLPQTANLNRGLWKRNETDVREWSQKEKLYIICGGFFGAGKIGNVRVPTHCWKVVQSVDTRKILFCGWFSNTTQATLDTLTIADLEKKLKSKIILLK